MIPNTTAKTTAKANARTRTRLAWLLGAAMLAGAPAALAQDAPAAAPPPASAASVVAAPETPKLRGFAVSLDVFVNRRHERGYALVAETEEHPAVGISARYDLARAGERGVLAVGLGVAGESDRNTRGGASLTLAELKSTSYYASAAYRWELGAHLAPYLAVAGGLAHARLSLQSPRGQAFEDTANSWFGRAGLGLRLVSSTLKLGGAPSMPFAFAFSAEAGGGTGTPLTFQIDGADAEDRIPGAPVALGKLKQLRTYLRFELAVVF